MVGNEEKKEGPSASPSAGGVWLLGVAALLSCAASVAAVRLAVPPVLDEKLTTLLLFLVVPAIPIVLFGVIRRWLGILIAFVIPFIWLCLAREGSDSLMLWLVPAVFAGLIIHAGRLSARGKLPRFAVAVALLASVLAVFWPGPRRPAQGPRVLLFGIDGGTWVLADSLISQRQLPNLAKLLEDRGHRAYLRSLPSLYSPQVWSTIATGCSPDVHGIQDFGAKQSDYEVGRLWDRMRFDGRSYGLCGYYFTWPPPSSGLGPNSFVLPSFLAPDSQAFPAEYSFYWQIENHVQSSTATMSWPAALHHGFRHGVRLSTLRRVVREMSGKRPLMSDDPEAYWRSQRMLVAIRGDLFAELIRTRRPEFAAVLFTEVDKVSHRFWKFIQPHGFPEVSEEELARYRNVITDLYVEIDCSLGRTMASAPEDVDLIIVSDHGFRRATKSLGGFSRISAESLIEILDGGEDLFGTNVDGRVFLRAVSDSEAERERVLVRTESILKQVRMTGSEQSIFQIVREDDTLIISIGARGEVPEGARLSINEKEYPFEAVIRSMRGRRGGRGWSGVHHPDGIYLLAGPAASRAVAGDSAHVLDVAPTVAALLKLPVSPRWQGRPLVQGVSLAEVEIADYPPPSIEAMTASPVQVDEALKEKLRAIGYLE
ncbi:alkaline phosphatase family protein [Candidatus Eisenbacteria bacterium]|uniref:Alkaline phosphatase family protein n=1 Tax=Eiseniibacteriota bacterium TaxID=2212470 RepID=A0ABV6YJ89_UNCEI